MIMSFNASLSWKYYYLVVACLPSQDLYAEQFNEELSNTTSRPADDIKERKQYTLSNDV